jgi:hypothetical protein
MNIPQFKISVRVDDEYAEVFWNTDDSNSYNSAYVTEKGELNRLINLLLDNNCNLTFAEVEEMGFDVKPTEEWWKKRTTGYAMDSAGESV